ncbi:MAG TPA: hypothetical protein VNM47_09085 [Terriglobia bacterium]|nr:hypothetical protein [Terriglobia bacterium]
MSGPGPIRNLLLTLFGACCTLLLLPAICKPQEEEKFKVIEVPLSVSVKEVPSRKLLDAKIYRILVTQQFAVLVGERSAWFMQGAGSPKPLSRFATFPRGFNWYAGGCVAGDRIVVGVGNYSEQTKKEEEGTSPGGFVGGPDPVGLLVINPDPPKIELIKSFKVVLAPPESGWTAPGYSEIPKSLTPEVESCSWGGGYLYIGEFSDISRLDLRSRTAEILTYEDLGSDKPAMWKGPDALWYTAAQSEGYTWVANLKNSGEKGDGYHPLNYELTYPDSVLRYEGRLLVSSAAGVVEIQPSRKTYVHYKTTEDKKKMAVYDLSIINGGLWGTRDDGFVSFDLAARSAVIFRLQGNQVSNDIKSLGWVGGRWLVGTAKGLVEVSPESLR